MRNAVITHYRRSPFHFASKGALAKVRPDDLAGQVIAKLVADSGIDPNDIEDIMVGCAFPEGEQGFNLGRLLAFIANLPISVAGATVNRFCGSSMQAIHMAVGAIAVDAGDVFVCAGVESMSRVPMMGFNASPSPGALRAVPAGLHLDGRSRAVLSPSRTNRERRRAGPCLIVSASGSVNHVVVVGRDLVVQPRGRVGEQITMFVDGAALGRHIAPHRGQRLLQVRQLAKAGCKKVFREERSRFQLAFELVEEAPVSVVSDDLLRAGFDETQLMQP